MHAKWLNDFPVCAGMCVCVRPNATSMCASASVFQTERTLAQNCSDSGFFLAHK